MKCNYGRCETTGEERDTGRRQFRSGDGSLICRGCIRTIVNFHIVSYN